MLLLYLHAIIQSKLAHKCASTRSIEFGQKYNKNGQIVINVDKYRSQIRNREVARSRLASLIKSALIIPKPRVKTKPSKLVNKKRLDSKAKRGKLKMLRKNKVEDR